jgi:secreted trypsin-like serine protease
MTITDFIVLAGESELNYASLAGSLVKRIVIHPNWNQSTNEADIALVQLITPLALNPDKIEPIAIPGTNLAEDSWAFISGWGSTYVNDSYGDYPEYSNSNQKWPSALQGAEVYAFNDSDCTYLLGNAYKLNSMLCAGATNTSGEYFVVDSCQGDSGGPLASFVNGTGFPKEVVATIF